MIIPIFSSKDKTLLKFSYISANLLGFIFLNYKNHINSLSAPIKTGFLMIIKIYTYLKKHATLNKTHEPPRIFHTPHTFLCYRINI